MSDFNLENVLDTIKSGAVKVSKEAGKPHRQYYEGYS